MITRLSPESRYLPISRYLTIMSGAAECVPIKKNDVSFGDLIMNQKPRLKYSKMKTRLWIRSPVLNIEK